MNEFIIYFLPQKAFALVILIILVVTWLKRSKGKTCLTPMFGVSVILLGAIIIWFYPIGVFACDTCEIVYWEPYFALPFIIFLAALGLTKLIKNFIN